MAPAERSGLLSFGEAEAVARLLDEYAAEHRDETIGALARELAMRLYDRMEA